MCKDMRYEKGFSTTVHVLSPPYISLVNVVTLFRIFSVSLSSLKIQDGLPLGLFHCKFDPELPTYPQMVLLYDSSPETPSPVYRTSPGNTFYYLLVTSHPTHHHPCGVPFLGPSSRFWKVWYFLDLTVRFLKLK